MTQGRILAYCRVSLDSERSGSIDKQRERLAAHVVSKADPGAIEWFTDESVSGSKVAFRDRPQGGRLWRSVSTGDRVVVTKIDRAARSVRDLLALVEHVKDRGASITFIDNDIDTGSSSGKLVLTILGGIAEFEAALISERRIESLGSFARAGRHAVGKAPIGFRSVENPNGRGLVIDRDPETAPLVRDAVLRVLAGEAQNVVRQSLGLSKTGFHNLLSNPRLAGMTPQNGGVVMVDGAPLVNPDAAILTPSEWQQLRQFMGRESKAWSRQTGYGRALTCGECGSRLYVNVSKRKTEYSTYRCRRPEGTHTHGEPAVGVMAHAANAEVESRFLDMWGAEPYRVLTVTEDETTKREAIAVAQMTLDAINRHEESATDAELESLAADRVRALKALRAARETPSERREAVADTGRTIGDVWIDADDSFREQLVTAFGSFIVSSASRGTPVADRIEWQGFTPEGVRLNGGARLALLDAPETTQRSFVGETRTLPAGLRVVLRPA